MNLFTRITATLGATADQAVSRFENHEAIAETAFKAARQAVVKARIQHTRVTRDSNELRARVDELKKDEIAWTRRAKEIALEDEAKALECLSQRHRCRELLAQTQARLTKHEQVELEVCKRVQEMEHRLEQINLQRNQMRSRESVAKAIDVMSRIESDGQDSVDAVFDRWEISIGETEMRGEVYQAMAGNKESLQREYESKEHADELKSELDALLNEDSENLHE
ncbi:MAG: PspA/IM30 family protein [Granulosicoccus sp.]